MKIVQRYSGYHSESAPTDYYVIYKFCVIISFKILSFSLCSVWSTEVIGCIRLPAERCGAE